MALDEPRVMDRIITTEGVDVLISIELEASSENILIEYYFIDEVKKLHVRRIVK